VSPVPQATLVSLLYPIQNDFILAFPQVTSFSFTTASQPITQSLPPTRKFKKQLYFWSSRILLMLGDNVLVPIKRKQHQVWF
jgi:hypothetical protein